MNLNRRLEKLEKESPNESSKLHLIILGEDESYEVAAKRYCCENGFSIEKLNHVIYIQPEDAAML